jgi:hypothetical protein
MDDSQHIRSAHLRRALILLLVVGALLPTSLTRVPAVAATESFSESFRGASLTIPSHWTSSRGATGTGPGGAVDESEFACLTALAPDAAPIAVQGVAGLATTARPGSGLIVGCPKSGDQTEALNSVGEGALRLTREAHSQSVVVLYNRPQTMADGLDITFSFAIHSGRSQSSTITGADGFSFFIKDGANSVDSAGASGGALGYALSTGTTTVSGIPGALLGVGFDFWGNFSHNFAGGSIAAACGASPFTVASSEAQAQDRVALRGPDTSGTSNGTCGYEYLGRSVAAVDFGRKNPTTGAAANGVATGVPATSRDASARRARIVIDKPGAGARVKVWVWPVGEPQPADTDWVLNLPQPAALQGVVTFKFGFGASTGWATNVHEIWDLGILLADPEVQAVQAADAAAAASASSAAGTAPTGPSLVCTPDPVRPGAEVTCSVTAGPPGGEILWRASAGDRVVGSLGVAMDDDGVGSFSFRAPSDASGAGIGVELVDWGVETSVAVSGTAVPTRLDAGSGGFRGYPPVLLLAGVVALIGIGFRRPVRQR